MKKQFIVLLFALPICLVAGAWPEVSHGHGAATVTLKSYAWAMLLNSYQSLNKLPESGTLLALGACCFVLAWFLRRRWMRSQAD